MSAIAGYSGPVTVWVGPDGGPFTAVEFGVNKWTLNKGRAMANVTTSKSGGIKQRAATIRDQSASFEFPVDSLINPEQSDFEEGAQIKVRLGLGESGYYHYTNKFIIERIEYSNDEDEDVTRGTLSGYANEAFQYGYAAPPPAPPAPPGPPPP